MLAQNGSRVQYVKGTESRNPSVFRLGPNVLYPGSEYDLVLQVSSPGEPCVEPSILSRHLTVEQTILTASIVVSRPTFEINSVVRFDARNSRDMNFPDINGLDAGLD